MFIFRSHTDLEKYLARQKTKEQTIGFVPTMGALHEGHLSLIEAARAGNNITVCSIFVNPTQFNNPEDLEKYPRTTDRDIDMLAAVGCDVLYLPEVNDIYPGGTSLAQPYELGYLETILEGSSRPGHFQGVLQVVERLLRIVQPDHLYLGQKDYQQCMVLKWLVDSRNIPVAVTFVPTRREPDGLAMSSRNRRLTPAQREVASVIYRCLISIQGKKDNASFKVVKKECEDLLEEKGFRPDYIMLADADTLQLSEEYSNNRPMVALIAAFLGDVRLIDNMIL